LVKISKMLCSVVWTSKNFEQKLEESALVSAATRVKGQVRSYNIVGKVQLIAAIILEAAALIQGRQGVKKKVE